ncbi:MAG: ABC transporter substrate-binding protein [Nitriliruptorales bacterium]|nr:ABC transporter substrate-binding protein [Nitriliruptorales bacterium]
MSGTGRLVPFVAVLALLIAGCDTGEPVDTDGTAGDGTGTETQTGTESPGDGDGQATGGTLVAAISSQPDQLDPHQTTAYPSFQVLENVYDTLVVPGPENLEFQPSLATDWTVSEDNLTWTFTLRDDVTFHDGSTFDSADVAYSYNRIIDEELANAFRFGNVEEIRTPDATTVEIQLSQPTPNLLANIGGFKGMAILSEGAAEEFDLSTEANGTGPFTLESVNPDSIELAAFDDYWGEGPFVDGVSFRFISEGTTALTELQTGNVHWTDNIPPQQIESLSGEEGIVLEQVPSVDYWYWTANFNREPFDDPNVRKALAYGINREDIAEAAHFGAATVNQTAIPEDSFWASDYAPYSHDPEQARQLLEEAGVSDLTMGLMVTDEFPQTVTVAEVIASQLDQIGITVEIQTETFATWLDRQGQGDFDAFMLGWLGNLDPFGFYHAQHICDGGFNFHGYCNEETDQLLEEASAETDQEARRDLYHQAVENIVDDNSYIYLYNPDVVQAWVEGLSGYTIRPDRAINFEQVRLP